jgi:hypothetical protein
MSFESSPDGPVRPSRARRGRDRSRRRGLIVGGAAIAVVALGVWLVFGRSGTPSDAGGGAGPSGSIVPPGGSARLLSFSVSGGAAPYLAVIGSDASASRAAAFPIPPDLSMVVPGQGDTLAPDVARLPGPSIQVALSNEIGAWTSSYAVMDLQGLSGVVDRMGGLPVNLALAVPTSAGVLGPGVSTLDGGQVAALLAAKGDSEARWEAVLTGLLATPPPLQRSDLAASSSLAGVQTAWSRAAHAEVLPLPTKTVAGSATVAQQPQLDQLVGSTWGTPAPIPAIVQNGNGTPGIGESVGRKIIPAGFRITLSQNAQSFDIATTTVIANGPHNVKAAKRARAALGVGQVQASPLPSGIGDITITVGKDFTG